MKNLAIDKEMKHKYANASIVIRMIGINWIFFPEKNDRIDTQSGEQPQIEMMYSIVHSMAAFQRIMKIQYANTEWKRSKMQITLYL